MSSMLSFLVLGPVIFTGPTPNIQLDVPSSVNPNFIPNANLNLNTRGLSYGTEQRDDYTYTPGIGAHKVHTRAVNWNTARRICEEEGGHLAIVNSNAESQVISRLMNRSEPHTGSSNTRYATIGFHGLYSDTDYVTIHGESLFEAGYSVWKPDEPNKNGENCGAIRFDGKLNDVHCNLPFAFVCELPGNA